MACRRPAPGRRRRRRRGRPAPRTQPAGRQALADSKRESRAWPCCGPSTPTAPPAASGCARHHGNAVADALKRGWIAPGAAADPAQMAGARSHRRTAGRRRRPLGELRALQPFLLFGVTGSGKTEVYCASCSRSSPAAAQALILVPEIALTPQLEGRVAGRFPAARVVSLHSALAEGARPRASCRPGGPRRHRPGTRLSVFRAAAAARPDRRRRRTRRQLQTAGRTLLRPRPRHLARPPAQGPSCSAPRPLPRELARRRDRPLPARRAGQPGRRGDAAGSPGGCAPRKLQHGLSEHLLRAVEARLQRASRASSSLNRRGYAPVLCPSCGWVQPLPHCTANMVLHLPTGACAATTAASRPPSPRLPRLRRPGTSSPSGRGTPAPEEHPRRALPHRPGAARRPGRRPHPPASGTPCSQIGTRRGTWSAPR